MADIERTSRTHQRLAPSMQILRVDTSDTLLRFAVVGGIGFLIEAVLLTCMTQLAGWTPWQARAPSFLTAVIATWALNRKHAFRGRELKRPTVEALFYICIQVCGAAINLALFGTCLFWLPTLAAAPVVPLAVGAAGGFGFNFWASNALLYSRNRAQAHK